MQQNPTNEQFPIGEFINPIAYDAAAVQNQINNIESLPSLLIKCVSNLSADQLNTSYREGSWTIQQLIHHVADSHINAYCRFKLAVTEEDAVIRPYFQDLWAETEDGKYAPVVISLQLIVALHARWVIFLRSLSESDYQKSYHHPEHNTKVFLYEAVASYSWHCSHHLAQIVNKIKKENWS